MGWWPCGGCGPPPDNPCTFCDGGGGPAQFSVEATGFSNGGCTDCGDSNGTFVADYVGESGGKCVWTDSFSTGGCGKANTVTVEIDKVGADWRVVVRLGAVLITYEWTQLFATVPDCLAFSAETIGPGGTNAAFACNWPGSVTLTAV
jgi:hypothetical protein